MINSMDQEAESIRSETLKLCWYMRGGLTYSEAMHISPQERSTIGGLVKENLEATKKTGLPFF